MAGLLLSDRYADREWSALMMFCYQQWAFGSDACEKEGRSKRERPWLGGANQRLPQGSVRPCQHAAISLCTCNDSRLLSNFAQGTRSETGQGDRGEAEIRRPGYCERRCCLGRLIHDPWMVHRRTHRLPAPAEIATTSLSRGR